MSYEIDRDPKREPSLREMAEKAVRVLDKSADKGYFLMIEGSRIGNYLSHRVSFV